MANHISLRGFVCSDIVVNTTDSGTVIGKFRMGSNMRRLDPITNQWVDGQTNWFRVNVFRTLASNAMVSIHKGDRILIVGKLKVTSYFRKDGTPATGVEIDADSIGPDLQFGTANYRRMLSARPAGQSNSVSPDNPFHLVGTRSHYQDEDEAPGEDVSEPGTGGEMDDDDDQTAARVGDGPFAAGGLQEGESADEVTGEITQEAVPF
ncbi:single-stranded DNA-binding protein [Arthrobacter sp. LAPM80]|uniref:single-stranded DNA-binding protein n=1 Tax=Arthrobacter sp. LAPM80 TaxID=3141788 RepID=UPI00398A5B05